MSDLDQARELVKTTLFTLDDQLRPQDADQAVADLAYLTPALAALIDRINRNLNSADRLPGLYTTASGGDARDQLRTARGQLTAARHAADTLTATLDAAHNTLATIGHGSSGDQPLAAVEEPRDGIQEERQWRATDG